MPKQQSRMLCSVGQSQLSVKHVAEMYTSSTDSEALEIRCCERDLGDSLVTNSRKMLVGRCSRSTTGKNCASEFASEVLDLAMCNFSPDASSLSVPCHPKSSARARRVSENTCIASKSEPGIQIHCCLRQGRR